MAIWVTVFGTEGCGNCARTKKALEKAGIHCRVVDVDKVEGLVDELRSRGVRELPLVVTDVGDEWSGLRIDKIVELSRRSIR